MQPDCRHGNKKEYRTEQKSYSCTPGPLNKMCKKSTILIYDFDMMADDSLFLTDDFFKKAESLHEIRR